MHVNLNIHGKVRFIRSIVSYANMSVRFDPECPTAYTDGRTIVLRPYNINWKDNSKEDTLWHYMLIHECYHNMNGNEQDLVYIKDNGIHMGSILGQILNLVMDHNIEKRGLDWLPGVRRWLEDGRSIFLNRKDDKAPTVGKLTPEQQQAVDSVSNKFYALWCLDAMARKTWENIDIENTLSKLTPDQQVWLDKLLPLLEEYAMTRTPGKENHRLAQKIYDLLEITKDEEALPKKTIISISPSIHKHDAKTGEEQYDIPSDVDIDKSPQDNFVLSEVVTECPSQHGIYLSNYSTQLSKKLGARLRVYSQDKYIGNQTRGRIKGKGMYKLATGGDRIFRKKVVKVINDTAVMLLADCSGSMIGHAERQAALSVISLSDCLRKLDIKHEVQCFTTRSNKVCNYVVKAFKDKANLDVLDRKLSYAYSQASENSDGESLLYAATVLREQKERRKIIIVLSDGTPSHRDNINKGICSFTKHIAMELDKSTIEVYSIGICDSSVQEFYKNHDVIHSVNDLERVLLNLIDKVIRGDK